MPKAEAGTPKALANKMKAKGLQRLRWYCTPCERQMRDENGFKQHCLSEPHARNMAAVGENAKSFINDYSNQFRRDFIQLLRTSHGEKPVHHNHFYQEYISNKEHVHMNATKWPSLTEFVKVMGREGVLRVTDTEKGLFIAWVDDSPEALRRKEAVQKKERQDRGDEEREQKLLQQQIERAQAKAKEMEAIRAAKEAQSDEKDAESKEAGPIKFGFGAKKPELAKPKEAAPSETSDGERSVTNSGEQAPVEEQDTTPPKAVETVVAENAPVKIAFGASKPKNVFAEAKKKNPFKAKKQLLEDEPRKMSEAERIMKEEMERKRKFSERGPPSGKRMRL